MTPRAPAPRVSPHLAAVIDDLHDTLARQSPGNYSYFIRVAGDLVAHGSPGQRLRPTVGTAMGGGAGDGRGAAR
jgi:hypothetical protein